MPNETPVKDKYTAAFIFLQRINKQKNCRHMENKVTVALLKAMKPGETKTFRVKNALACESGKTLASKYGHILKCRFSVRTDYTDCTLTITKNPE